MSMVYNDGSDQITLQELNRKIDNAILDYCNLDIFPEPLDLASCSTLQFQACLIYVSNTVLKRTVNVQRNNVIDYNNSTLLLGLLDKYVTICYLYNKIPGSYGFTLFMGMSSKTVFEWLESDNPTKRKVTQILNTLHEQGLINKLEDSKSPVGQIAAGNVVHNWDNRRAQNTDNSRSIESSVISSKYLQLASDDTQIASDSSTIPELPSNDSQ